MPMCSPVFILKGDSNTHTCRNGKIHSRNTLQRDDAPLSRPVTRDIRRSAASLAD